MFGRRTQGRETSRLSGGLFHRRDKDRVAGGFSKSRPNHHPKLPSLICV